MIFVASAISLLSYSASCSAFFESTATNIGFLFTESVSFACANQKSSCLYSGVLLSFKVQIQERYGEHYDKIRMPRWHER